MKALHVTIHHQNVRRCILQMPKPDITHIDRVEIGIVIRGRVEESRKLRMSIGSFAV